jgi:hypothetical protein
MEEYLSANETYKTLEFYSNYIKILVRASLKLYIKMLWNMNLIRITSLMNEKKYILSTIKIQF